MNLKVASISFDIKLPIHKYFLLNRTSENSIMSKYHIKFAMKNLMALVYFATEN